MISELRGCPFCGEGNSIVSLWFDDVAKRWRVGCGRCGCSTGISPRDTTEAPAITAWNTRAPMELSDGPGRANALAMDWLDESERIAKNHDKSGAFVMRSCALQLQRVLLAERSGG